MEWKTVVSLHSLSTEKRVVEKEGGGDSTLKRMKQEIACVSPRVEYAGEDTEESKVNEEILTMKSLILAQDER